VVCRPEDGHPPQLITRLRLQHVADNVERVSRVSCSRWLFPRFIPFASVSSWRHLQRRQRAVTTLISFDVAAFLVAVTRVIDQYTAHGIIITRARSHQLQGNNGGVGRLPIHYHWETASIFNLCYGRPT